MSQASKDVVIDTRFALVTISPVVDSQGWEADVVTLTPKRFGATCAAEVRGDAVVVVQAPRERP